MNDPQARPASPLGAYARVADKLDSLQPWFLLILRIYIGYQAMVAGWGHLHNIDKTTGFFASLHIPMPRANVYIAGYTELVGGGLLLIGLLSRLVAIPFTFNFLIAILSVNLSDPKYREAFKNIIHNQDIVLKDDAFPFFFVGLMILIFGPGLFSIDGLIKRAWHKGRKIILSI
jgi:putative oxidoreductase